MQLPDRRASSLTARRNRKLEDVFAQIIREPRFHALVEEHAAELLARAQHLAPPVSAPSRIVGGQVEELEQERLFVRVELAAKSHDSTTDIDRSLHHVAESALRRGDDLGERNGRPNDARHVFGHPRKINVRHARIAYRGAIAGPANAGRDGGFAVAAPLARSLLVAMPGLPTPVSRSARERAWRRG